MTAKLQKVRGKKKSEKEKDHKSAGAQVNKYTVARLLTDYS